MEKGGEHIFNGYIMVDEVSINQAGCDVGR